MFTPMDIKIPHLSLDTYIAIGLVIATPWLYYLFSSATKNKALSLSLLIHTLYLLHALLVAQSPNIFKSLDLPVNISADYMREKLVESLEGQNVPLYLDTLLKRLGLTDLRLLYFRFGHNVLTTCLYCQSFNEFALYALPTPLLEYVREIAFIGALTLPTTSPMAHLRSLGLGSLIVLLMTEVYQTLTVHLVIPFPGENSNTTMWHDTFVQTRHVVFLLLPFTLLTFTYLGLHRIPILNIIIPSPKHSTTSVSPPTTPPAPPRVQYQIQGLDPAVLQQTPLNQLTSKTMQTLDHLVPTIHLIKYTHAAIMRSRNLNTSSEPGGEYNSNLDTTTTTTTSSLHSHATQWWAEEAREGSIVRNDENIKNIMRSTGLSFDEAVVDEAGGSTKKEEGILLTSAKKAVEILKEHGGVKSEHWVF